MFPWKASREKEHVEGGGQKGGSVGDGVGSEEVASVRGMTARAI